MTQLSSRPVTALELHQEIMRRKEEVDNALAELAGKGNELGAIAKKLMAEDDYEKAQAKARLRSVIDNPKGKEADHKAYVSQATDTERFNAALTKEMLRFQYKVLDARQSQLSATQTDAKVVMQEMNFVQTGPATF